MIQKLKLNNCFPQFSQQIFNSKTALTDSVSMWVYESIIASIDSVSEWVVDWFTEFILTEPNSSFLLRQIYKQVIQPDLQTHLIMINHNLSLSQAIYAFTTDLFSAVCSHKCSTGI